MARQLTGKQQAFLNVLFDEAGGNMVMAKKMAGYSDTTTTTEIVKDFPVAANDTVSIVNGKLVLEPGDVIVLSANNASNVKCIVSVLETLN